MFGRRQGAGLGKRMRRCAFIAVAYATIGPVQAETEFPFEVELLFDAKPLPRGHARHPRDLAAGVDGKVVVDGDTIEDLGP